MSEVFKNLNFKNYYFYFFIFLSLIAEYKSFSSSFFVYLLAIIYIVLNLKKINLSKRQYLYFLVFFFYLLIPTVYSNDVIILLKNIKFWFGFILIYIFFKCFKEDFNYLFFFRFCCLIIIIEAIMINTFIDQDLIYLRPTTAVFFGFYERPPSLCGIPAVSSVFIVLLFYFLHLSLKKISYVDQLIFFTALACLFSMTGFLLTYIVMILLYFNKTKKNFTYWNNFFSFIIISTLGILTLFVLEHLFFDDFFNFQKLTPSYFFETISSHLNSILNMHEIKSSYLEFLIGSQIKMLNTSGDNAYSIFFLQNGILGILIFFLFFLTVFQFSKNDFLKFLIIIFSCFHYYSLGNILVQIIIAKILNQNQKN